MKNLEKTRLIAIGRYGVFVFVSIPLVLIWASAAPGQRGMGDGVGVAQQMLKPSLVHISGKLQEIKTHLCENTTGQADLGIHLILKDKQGQELNVHLGPAPALSETIKQLKIDEKIELIGFRTDKIPLNQYVAKILIFDGNVIKLRDSNLRPYWAGSRLSQKTLSPYAKTNVDQRTAMRRSCYYYSWPKSWQRCYLQNGQRLQGRRRCRRRACRRRWEW